MRIHTTNCTITPSKSNKYFNTTIKFRSNTPKKPNDYSDLETDRYCASRALIFTYILLGLGMLTFMKACTSGDKQTDLSQKQTSINSHLEK